MRRQPKVGICAFCDKREDDRRLRELVAALAEDPIAATPRYVRDHGRSFTPAPLPGSIEAGKGLDCYMNARFLRLEHLIRFHRPGWAYAEGYGLAEDRAVRHAWNVVDDGTVIDQTWPAPESKAYFGVLLDDATMDAWADWYQRTRGVLTPLEWVAATAWHDTRARGDDCRPR
jgi:hypothetical protein